MIEVKGLSRSAHGAVTTIHYKVSPKFLSFFLELIEVHPDRRLIYRVRDGFPAFTHDVLWNHGLCKLKDILEAE